MATEGWWTIAGTVSAALGAVVIIYQVFIQPKWRRRKMKTSCKAWFEIPSSDQRLVTYAVQNKDLHFVEELTLASHSVFELEILYRSTISLTSSEIYFGCGAQDYRDLERKPIMLSLWFPLIERGPPEESPETHPETNIVDRHKYYHVRKSKIIARNETYSLGFKIQTREAGKYRFQMFFSGEEIGSIKNELIILVEEHPSTRMRCVLPEHRCKGCYIPPKDPKPR